MQVGGVGSGHGTYSHQVTSCLHEHGGNTNTGSMGAGAGAADYGQLRRCEDDVEQSGGGDSGNTHLFPTGGSKGCHTCQSFSESALSGTEGSQETDGLL